MRVSIWLGGKVTSTLWSSSPCRAQMSISWTHGISWPSSELIGSSLHWFTLTQNGPCPLCWNDLWAFLCEIKQFCSSVTTNTCRFGIAKWLWMAVDKARRALQRKISLQQVEVHQQWNKTTEAKHIYLLIHTHINISVQHRHFICTN